MLRSTVKVPGRTKMRTLCEAHVAVVEASMMFDLPSNARFSLALDAWTSKHHQSFLGVSAYYIDKDWGFQEVLLGFKPLLNEHTGQEMAKVVSTLLMKYSIGHRLLAITADNAPSNGTLRRCLAENLRTHHGIEWNYEEGYVRCMAHVVQLVLDAIFRVLKVDSNTETTEDQRPSTQVYEVSPVISYPNTIKKVINYHLELSPRIITSD